MGKRARRNVHVCAQIRLLTTYRANAHKPTDTCKQHTHTNTDTKKTHKHTQTNTLTNVRSLSSAYTLTLYTITLSHLAVCIYTNTHLLQNSHTPHLHKDSPARTHNTQHGNYTHLCDAHTPVTFSLHSITKHLHPKHTHTQTHTSTQSHTHQAYSKTHVHTHTHTQHTTGQLHRFVRRTRACDSSQRYLRTCFCRYNISERGGMFFVRDAGQRSSRTFLP